MREVTFTRAALKVLVRIPRNEADRIRQKIHQYASDPASLANNVTAMKGSSFVRLRVGDWRVVMNDQGRVIEVVKIGPRGGVNE